MISGSMTKLRAEQIKSEDALGTLAGDLAALRGQVADIIGAKEPNLYAEAMKSPDAELWKVAIEEELGSLEANGTWEFCDLPEGRRSVDYKWVFKVKRDAAGMIVRYKARLVARGFTQVEGEDFEETFAPVMEMPAFRVLLALTAHYGWTTRQVDVKNAYLNGSLDDEIFMRIPEGLPRKGRKVLRLLKGLYGLKQAGRVWNEELLKALKDLDFVQLQSDSCVFCLQTGSVNRVFAAVWVDNIHLFGQLDADVMHVVEQLERKYRITDEGGLNFSLGIKIDIKAGEVKISQEGYILEKAKEFGLTSAKDQWVPMIAVDDAEGITPTGETRPFRSLVGGLLHAARFTRPDIAYATSVVSRRMHDHSEGDWERAKKVLQYLKTTAGHGIKYNGSSELLEVFVDASYASDKRDFKSTSGYVIKMFGGGSKKQPVVALSTAEAEYYAASSVCQELLWV
jgi:hypothetical protein